jgi:RHS repeat-associated protein
VIGPRNPQRPLGKRRGYACGRGGSFCHRWYEPQTGRYTRPDPVGLLGGLNAYSYAWADPINFSDPLGLKPRPMRRPAQRTRPCNSQEFADCIEICSPRGVESCKVNQTFRPVRAKEGFVVYEWKDGPLSCSCREPPGFLERCRRTVRDIVRWMADNPPHPPPLPLPGPVPLPVPIPVPR